jgi:hypothetical protein
MILIDRKQIEIWGASTHGATGLFPLLIDKLIRETTPKDTEIRMPSGTGVYLRGADGIVKCSAKSYPVPLGFSWWEIGTNGDLTKAENDYDKRTNKDKLKIDRSKFSFVFVTTLHWDEKQKNDWIEEKKKDGKWLDIKLIDAVDLVSWLDNSKVAARWFARILRVCPPDGIFDSEDYWKALTYGPKGQLTPNIILSGRSLKVKALRDFLIGPPGLKAIQASTKEEAIAFILASILRTEDQLQASFLSRSLVVCDEKGFHGLRINKNALNLISNFDNNTNLWSAALVDGHHVLVPIGRDDNFNPDHIIDLPVIQKEQQVDGLMEMGLSREEAEKYSLESGRDYTILKSLLGFPYRGNWVKDRNISELIPALLIGRWDENYQGDKEILEKISNKSYEDYSSILQKWLRVESSPILKIGETWRLTSPLNAWTILSKYIGEKELTLLKNTFKEVLGEINPKIEMPIEERRMAAFRGIKSNYSDWCREGITQSLILLSIYGERFGLDTSISYETWVDQQVSNLLLNANGELWASRNVEMPLLAEASPTSFFDAAYHSLSLGDKPIMNMFIEEDDFLTPTSRHTGLLWALEGLAWNEEYFEDSTLLLAKLAANDPGGKLSNRPINSLTEIFKPWHYQTQASLETRMNALKEILNAENEIGWTVLSRMITRDSDVAFPTHKMRWRLFDKTYEKRVQTAEIVETNSRVVDLLLQYFDFTETRLITLLEKCESLRLNYNDAIKVLAFIQENLEKVDIADSSAWTKSRQILSNHRSYPKAAWSLPESILTEYEKIYQRLTPNDPLEQILWMFNDNWPSFPEGIDKQNLSVQEQEDLKWEKLNSGLKHIYEDFGFMVVKESAIRVERNWVFGIAAANVIVDWDEIVLLCDYLESTDPKARNFIDNFIRRKSYSLGNDWTIELYQKLVKNGSSEITLGRCFVPSQQLRVIWNYIELLPEKAQEVYWKELNPTFWDLPAEDLNYGIEKLVSLKRFLSAIDMAQHRPEKIESKKLAIILELAATQKSDEQRHFDSYEATRILEELENRNDLERENLINLEWLYIPLLATFGSIRKPAILNDELASNPNFFIEVLKFAYKSENENDPTDSANIRDELRKNRWKNAYDLLNYWDQIPGVDRENVIDEEFLNEWTKSVRDKAEQVGRLKVADMHIGKILAKYPEKKEEPWPPAEFCALIDSIDSRSLSSGFSSEAFNKRGFSTRGPYDGGNIERGHAKLFHSRAKNYKRSYPITSKILKNLAKGYEEDARRQDEQAERDKLDS